MNKDEKRAAGVLRARRAGWSPRKIAKHFGMPVKDVKAILARAESKR